MSSLLEAVMRGSGPSQFTDPRGIAVHPTTGQIFVADMINNRIQVFTKDLIFSHTITHKNIWCPCDVALDNEGYLYITEYYDNLCITKLTTTGEYMKRIAILDSTDYSIKKMLIKSLTSISHCYFFHLTIHNNLVYVSKQW